MARGPFYLRSSLGDNRAHRCPWCPGNAVFLEMSEKNPEVPSMVVSEIIKTSGLTPGKGKPRKPGYVLNHFPVNQNTA